ncbi:MAG TPA: aspartate 1-decarboxylase [Candidatus Angelobacter sp.]|jgi:aspartate 1-decarboxylase|nr:aspartate 1-decarboxylase [Candidatus Angelobacter sp.]
MLLQLLKAKIHRATVTRSDLHYEGSIAIDELLMEAAGIVPYEAVHIWNITNGERLQTYALPSPKGSGEICLNGAAARRAEVGDLVIIAAFGLFTNSDDLTQHSPRIVFVDAENRLAQEMVVAGSLNG